MFSRSDDGFFPLPIDDKYQVPVISILLQGLNQSRALLMVLDTGASITTVPRQTAIDIGLDPSKPESMAEMITASSKEYIPVVRASKVLFCGFEFKDVEIGCSDMVDESPVRGLIGLNILSQFDMFFGFQSKELRIWR